MREAKIHRKTLETDIEINFNIDGTGSSNISTCIGFFDHMLNAISKHGFFDIKIDVMGDLEVDTHHIIEDTGIVLGQTILKALGDKESIKRYGSSIIPMDETLVLCAIDLSGRPYLNFDANFTTNRIGIFDTEMFEEFFRALSYSLSANIHIKVLSGKNNHHIAEGIFKSFAKALDEATTIDRRIDGVLSTKGNLD